MSLENSNASSDTSATTLNGTDPSIGQPSGTVEEKGQPEQMQDAPATEQPVEDLGTETIDYEKQYKTLQTEFNKRNESEKAYQARLEKLGGLDQIEQWHGFLSNNKDFEEFVQAQQRKNVLGIDESSLDDTQREALQLVEQIVEHKLSAAKEEMVKKEISPLVEKEKQRNMEANLSLMDKEFGEINLAGQKASWRDFQDTMAELAHTLPIEVQDNPTVEDMQDLFYKALRKEGKMEAFGQAMYERTVAEKRANASEAPPEVARESAPTKASSLLEAMQQAKKKHGISGEVRSLMN